MKTVGTILLIIGGAALGFGALILLTTSSYSIDEKMINAMFAGGSLSLIVGAIFFVGGSIEEAILRKDKSNNGNNSKVGEEGLK
ncbi:hypothetical protein J7S95_18030 [Providencia stuartii]|uniref:hypothetical protein n=1 Tax=Providencia TaxID=586 RepID=UPI001B734C7F|nr:MULTISPECIES: hypothetical protein [Providencia]MBQ0458601.1 hypothetical protein [Providencia stuartii]